MKDLLFCSNCRSVVDSADQLHFVDKSVRGFCSEECIVEFFSPYMEAFNDREIEIRDTLNLPLMEVDSSYVQDDKLFTKCLNIPDEVRSYNNEIGEEFFYHVLNVGSGLFYILACFHYDDEASFVFFKTVTKETRFLDLLLDGSSDHVKDEVDGIDDLSKIENISPEIIEEIENKKSQLLAQIINTRKASDIPFEMFYLYEEFMEPTFDDADEEYRNADESGDIIISMISTYKKDDLTFFYILLCVEFKSENGEKIVMPAFGFPTVDEDTYLNYSIGERIKGRVNN